jgi:hypothetical protein
VLSCDMTELTATAQPINTRVTTRFMRSNEKELSHRWWRRA